MTETHHLSRSNDPSTSKSAAVKQPKRAPIIRAAILRLLEEDGALTHDQIIERYYQRVDGGHLGYPLASASSIRTRTAELARDHKVHRVPAAFGKSAMGNRAHLWAAVADEAVSA